MAATIQGLFNIGRSESMTRQERQEFEEMQVAAKICRLAAGIFLALSVISFIQVPTIGTFLVGLAFYELTMVFNNICKIFDDALTDIIFRTTSPKDQALFVTQRTLVSRFIIDLLPPSAFNN